MAFRGRRRFFRSGRRGPSVRSLAATSRKWIGFHSLVDLDAVVPDPLFPSAFEIAPTFVPLVAQPDYAFQSNLGVDSFDEAQEKTRILRTICHFNVSWINLPPESQIIAYASLWWYFAVLNRDDVLNAGALAVATGSIAGPLDPYNAGLEPPPALWRQHIKRFGFDGHIYASSPVLTDQFAFYQETRQRSFDFKPRVRMQMPEEWYLVVGANIGVITPPTPPSAFTGILEVAARTLISD